MKTKYILIPLLAATLISCSSRNSAKKASPSSSPSNPIEMAKPAEITIDKDEFLDIDFNDFKQRRQNGEIISPEEMAKVKAALHRFYEHVTLEGDKYKCDLQSGSEINISEVLFKKMMTDLQTTNDDIKKMKDQGIDIKVPQITEDYLNNILN